MFHFAYDADGRLAAESVPLERIAAEVSTPTFVYAQATLERHYTVYDQAFADHPHLVCYSVKANSNRAVLRLLADLGSGADIVSRGELMRALEAGVPADRIVFSGVGKTRQEMEAALDAEILCFNVESAPELELLACVAAERNVIAPVSLRVNPDVDAMTHPYIATGLSESKFGIPIRDARGLARRLLGMSSIHLTGVDCHIGSQLTSLDPLMEALDAIVALADDLARDGHAIEHIDIGGGLGIPYKGETPPHPTELGAAVVRRMKGRKERLILEPGRVIVGNAGVLLSRVLYVKANGSKTFVIVDAAMNDLMRPSLYQAHHDIWPVTRRGGTQIPVDVVGPICESGDRFAQARPLEPLLAGDLVAIMSSGAYGFTMSSTYNSRPRAAEVLVSGDRFAVVRARERMEALMEGESVPDWFSNARR